MMQLSMYVACSCLQASVFCPWTQHPFEPPQRCPTCDSCPPRHGDLVDQGACGDDGVHQAGRQGPCQKRPSRWTPGFDPECADVRLWAAARQMTTKHHCMCVLGMPREPANLQWDTCILSTKDVYRAATHCSPGAHPRRSTGHLRGTAKGRPLGRKSTHGQPERTVPSTSAPGGASHNPNPTYLRCSCRPEACRPKTPQTRCSS